MIRISIAVTNDLSYDQRIHRICNTLVDAGYEVILVGRVRKHSSVLKDRSFRQVRIHCWFNNGPLFYAEYNIRLFIWLLVGRFDIGVACDLDTVVAVRLAAWIKRKYSVFDAHELFTEVPELEGRNGIKRIWTRIGKLTVPGFDLRYTVGEHIARLLTDKYQAPFAVIRNVPVAIRESIQDMSERRNVILYQGALNEGRGLECAIDAMQQISGYELHLVGEGDCSHALRAYVADRGLADKVKFLGYVSPDELPALARKATIGLNLLEQRSQSYYYSLANKFFDYMHAGLPSVNMNFPEYKSILAIDPVGICIDKLESKQLARQMRTLLDDSVKLQRMAEACKIARERYTWKSESQQLLALYAEVVKAHKDLGS